MSAADSRDAGRSPADRAPVSWEALAAELAETGDEAAERRNGSTGWDAVAAELAVRVAERPAPPDEVARRYVDETGGPADAGTGGPADAENRCPTDAGNGAPVDRRVAAASGAGARSWVDSRSSDDAGPAAAVEPVEVLDAGTLRGRLEALLFVMEDPVDEPTLTAALRCAPEQVGPGLADLAADYDRRGAGIELRRVGERWRLYTREKHVDVVERHLAEASRSRLSAAALETLAVIAYRQPVTRARVSAIRGVGVDGVMRTLLGRGLVQEVGTDSDGGGGGLYATTPLFLERLGLRGLDELPELAPLLPEPSSLLDEHPDA